MLQSLVSTATSKTRNISRLPLKRFLVQRACISTPQSSSIIYKSPHDTITIPQTTIWNVVGNQLADHGDRYALICGISHDKLTYNEMYNTAKRTAVALALDGVQRGDVVLIHSVNCMEYPILTLALTSLGAIISPSSPMFNASELSVQAIASKAKFIITHRALENVAIEVAERVGIDKSKLYTVGTSKEPKQLKAIDEVSKRLFENTFQFETIDPSDTLLLPFSSGTTGLPKGVSLSGTNMLANALQVHHVETDISDHMLGVLPFFHIYALLLIHLVMRKGVANVILPQFEPTSFLNVLSTYKIKTAHIAPPIALFLAHHPLVDQYDLSSTKTLVSGGAPMGTSVENLVAKRLNMEVRQAYGMTEASPAVNYTEPTRRKPGSVGRLLPNTELRVKCTVTDKDLPPHTKGELLYRGPQVMKGYLDNEAATTKTLMSDGFLRTGDIGYIDEEGFVFVVDRVKELIKYKGHQIAPAELEDVLNKHPEISDSCCVRGYDKSDGEEIPKAYVVLKDPNNQKKLTEEMVMAFVAENVAPFKKIRQVEFIDSIPKSLSGKILRRQLQERENKQ